MPSRRRIWTIGALAAAAVLAAAALSTAEDILARLGVQEAIAKDQVLHAFEYGGTPIAGPARKAFRGASPESRATLASAALTWLKAYTESADFRTRYTQLRERRKPEAPKSGAEQFDEMQKDQRKQLEETKQNLSKATPELRKQLEKSVQQWEAQMSDPKQQAMARQIYEQTAADQQKQYQKRLAEWEETYPADPRSAVAKRLRSFLDLSAGVDYGAELAKPARAGGVTKFADPNLEKKPEEWKLCYRAGKPAVEAARAFATKWMVELEKK